MGIVAFLDSGVGGFLYLQKFKEVQPEHSVYYLADTRGFPYGVKTPLWIKNRTVLLSHTLLEKTLCDVIVLACNTASVVAINSVRNSLKSNNTDVVIVGVVPAIKLAIDLNYKKIYIMSTTLTASTHYTKNLMNEYKKMGEFIVRGIPKLVQAVEDMVLFSHNTHNTCANNLLENLLENVLEDVQKVGADVIVLACTHFLYIKKRMELCANKKNMDITILDSLDGVVRRIQVCLDNKLKNSPKKHNNNYYKKPIIHITSEKQTTVYKKYARNNAMIYDGVWNI